MITHTADKYFGLFYIGKKEQEESKIIGRSLKKHHTHHLLDFFPWL